MMKERIKKGSLFGIKWKKMHGHTKIILRDDQTGEEKVVADKDNLVTVAIPNIFKTNLGGTIDYDSMLPLREMFAGVMCFHNALTETDLVPENGTANPLVCFAGKTAHEQASTKRGNPNGGGTIQPSPTSYRFQWDFAANVGNSASIASVALCHGEGGDIGLEPLEALENEYCIHTLCNNSAVNYVGQREGTGQGIAQDDYLHGVLAYDIEEDIGWRVTSDGTVQKVQFCYDKIGLNYKTSQGRVLEEHELSLVGDYFFYENGHIYSVVVSGTKDGITLYDTNMSTWTTSSKTIEGSGFTLLKPSFGTRPIKRIGTIAKSGNFIYLPTEARTTFVKTCIAAGAESMTVCASHLPSGVYVINTTRLSGQMSLSEGLVFGENYIINNNDVYPTTLLPRKSISGTGSDNENARMWIPIVGREPACLEWSWTYADSNNRTNYWYLAVAHPTMYLATIQNLDEPVTKTSANSMTIIYTLSEAEEE